MTFRLVFAVLIVMVPGAAWPQTVPLTRSCFCLVHPATGAVAFDRCEKAVPLNAYTPVVTCRVPKGAGSVAIADWTIYKMVPDGTPPCNPCDPPMGANVKDVPRDMTGRGP